MKVAFFALVLSPLLFAAQPTEYYWQIGRNLSGKGAHTSTLVVGKREYPDGKNTKIDTQLYFSSEEGPTEYSYVFHEDTKKLEVLVDGGNVGSGTFKCDAKRHCSYKYEITKGTAYTAEGSDTPVNKDGVLYREVSHIKYPNAPKADVFTADYLSLDEAGYNKIRNQILKK